MIFLSALAAAIGFRMNLFNIGVEGQYVDGVVRRRRGRRRRLLPGLRSTSSLTLVVAMVAGSVWAGIAGVLKVTRGVSEVISTIMLNAIAIDPDRLLAQHLRRARPATRGAPPMLAESSQLDGWTPVPRPRRRRSGRWRSSRCWPASAFSFVLNQTSFGFDLRATGMSETRGRRVRRQGQPDGRDLDAAVRRDRRPDLDAGVLRGRPLLRHRRSRPDSASPASRWPCSAATGRSASSSAPCCSPSSTSSPTGSRSQTDISQNVVQITQGVDRARGRRRLRGRPAPPGRPPSRRAVRQQLDAAKPTTDEAVSA